eukprot:750236-Hanusia_phi.AAC.1
MLRRIGCSLGVIDAVIRKMGCIGRRAQRPVQTLGSKRTVYLILSQNAWNKFAPRQPIDDKSKLNEMCKCDRHSLNLKSRKKVRMSQNHQTTVVNHESPSMKNQSGQIVRNYKKLRVFEIPEEILDSILNFAVRGHCDICKYSLTCKKWYSVVNQETCWKRLCIRGWGHRSDIVQVPFCKEPTVTWKDYYKNRLLSHQPLQGYLKHQHQMTVSIRSILINWLLAVIDEFQINDFVGKPIAHHLTVAILDKYCSSVREVIATSQLQTIGAACAVLALHPSSDLRDINPKFFKRAAYYTDGACTSEQVLAVAENIKHFFPRNLLSTSKTAFHTIDVLLTAMQKNNPSSSTFCLAHYLGELSLQAEASLKFTQTQIGASSYALACHTLGWSESLWMSIIKSQLPNYSFGDLQECMSSLQELLKQALNMLTKRNKKTMLPHVIVKYSRRDRQHVAKVVVTPTAWPLICPHGVGRDLLIPCTECQVTGSAVNFSLDGEVEDDDGQESVFSMDEDPEFLDVTMEDATFAINTGVDESVEMLPVLERHDAHTPINAPLPEDSLLRAPSDSSPAVNCAVQGENDKGQEQRGLQDVSFGMMSDACDNSFIHGPDAAFEPFDDRRSSFGDRRASMGSVLGAVFEEDDSFASETVPEKGTCASLCCESAVAKPNTGNISLSDHSK